MVPRAFVLLFAALAQSVQAFGPRDACIRAVGAAGAAAAQRRVPPQASLPSRAKVEGSRLNAIFSACGKGRSISREESEQIRSIGGDSADRYGEITPKGFAALGSRLRLGPLDTFVDCGSGTGMAVTQSVIEFDVRAASGVELSATRHATARRELALLPEAVAARVTLECGDVSRQELEPHREGAAIAGETF